MSKVDILLSRLESVMQKNKDRAEWRAKCPAHADRSPSLNVKEGSNGVVLLHCYAGCDPLSVLYAVNLDFKDIYPETISDHLGIPRVKRPFTLAESFETVRYEALLVAECAKIVAKGEALEPETIERLTAAANKIERAWETAYA